MAQRHSVVVQLYQFIPAPGPACILSPHEALEGLDYLCSLQLMLAAVTPTRAKDEERETCRRPPPVTSFLFTGCLIVAPLLKLMLI